MNETSTFQSSDHDALVELKVLMQAVRADIKDLRDNTTSRLAMVEQSKLDRTEAIRIQSEQIVTNTDHETRLRSLEQQRWMIVGGSAVLAAIVGYASNILGNLH